MKAASIFYLDFLDVHGGYYTATIYKQLHSFFAILFNYRKNIYSLLLHVESNKFVVLLKFLSYCYSCCCCRKERVTNVATGVVGGNFVFLTTNQARTNEDRTLESKCQNFSLSPILFFSSSCRIKNKKIKQKRCSAALARVVARCRTSQQYCEV
jgi:hypothetical protein